MALGTNTRGAVSVTRTYCTRAVGRKRVITDDPGAFEGPDAHVPPYCGTWVQKPAGGGGGRKKRAPAVDVQGQSHIQMLPQDLLVRILCGVHHSDLDQLMLVCKAVRDAALIAKRIHFAFSTPMCKPAFTRAGVVEADDDTYEMDDDDAPNAPRRSRRCESRLDGKRIESLALALFQGENDDDDDHPWSSHQGSMLLGF